MTVVGKVRVVTVDRGRATTTWEKDHGHRREVAAVTGGAEGDRGRGN